MTERTYANVCVRCSDQGYLENLNDWTEDVGLEIAKEEGIEMTGKH